MKEVIAGIQKKDVDEVVKHKVKRTGGPDLVRSWDCSQIENEEEVPELLFVLSWMLCIFCDLLCTF